MASILSLGNQSSGSKGTRKIRQGLKPPILKHITSYNHGHLEGESQHSPRPFNIRQKDQGNRDKEGRDDHTWPLPLLFDGIKIHIRYRIGVFAYNILELEATDFNL